MLRAWQDVIVKWRLVPDDLPDWDVAGREQAYSARSALLDGRLDEALERFDAAARLRDHPLDQVGIGDVYLARGKWRTAEEHYRRALPAGGVAALLAKLGIGQVLIGEGRATASIADLEHLVADRPQDPTLRYYLASAWFSVAEQSRSRTADDTLVITSEQQLLICEQAAERILSLEVDDTELDRGAEQLRGEVALGRRWTWAPEGIAVSLAVLVVAMGLITVVAGGLMGSPALVIAGVVLGALLLFVIVWRFRRQTWRRRADEMAPRITRPGV
ncbi:tetratricopeptide repeat protein [Actinophytocola sp.]|uniref:tetratricopeptide repeat protein n=1 Tax=Actinophytocola sp. TaxID=1872138 RepID=UPI003D6A11D1